MSWSYLHLDLFRPVLRHLTGCSHNTFSNQVPEPDEVNCCLTVNGAQKQLLAVMHGCVFNCTSFNLKASNNN